MNNVNLIGRLGQDPELRYTQGGTAVATLSIATNRAWKNKDGELKEATDWHKIVVYGAAAENHKKHLSSGSQIGITGELRTDTYEDKDGNNRKSVYVVAGRVDYLSRATSNGSSSSNGPAPTESDDPTFTDDDIPF